MRVAFRVEANGVIGWGHFFRCLALASEIGRLGHQVVFLSRGLPGELASMVVSHGVALVKMRPKSIYVERGQYKAYLGAGQEEDARETSILVSELAVGMVIVDNYGVNGAWLHIVSGLDVEVVSITDFESETQETILIDYGFDASREKHQRDQNLSSRDLYGPSFALLMPHEPAVTHSESESEQGNVVVALGSAVDKEFYLEFAVAVKEAWTTPRIKVISPLEVDGHFGGERLEFLGVSPSSRSAMLSADFVVSSAGVSMYERMAAGIPGIAIGTADNQFHALEALKRMNFTRVLDAQVLTTPRALLDAILDAQVQMDREVEALTVSSAVDFHGSKRAAMILFPEVLNGDLKVRAGRDSDCSLLLRWANEIETRASAISTGSITASQHLKWCRGLRERGSRLFIFEINETPVGQARFEKTGSEVWELDFSVDPAFRGFGLGSRLLRLTMGLVDGPVEARVKAWNLRSQSSLTAAGFIRVGEDYAEDPLLIFHRAG